MIVDWYAYVGEWPTYELSYRDAEGLLHLMDRCGVDAACVSLAGGMFYHDAREANERLCREIAGHRDRLWPVGTVNPTVTTWREDVDDGLERLGLAGFRIHPAHQGFALAAREVERLAAYLARVERPLFLALYVDEERLQHPAIRVPDVAVADVVALIARAPETTLVLNAFKTTHAVELYRAGADVRRVYMDVDAMDQDFEGLRCLVEQYGAGHLVYGSQMPFLYLEAAQMVVAHAGLSEAGIAAIMEENWASSPVLARLAPQPAR
jgi:predicted TIM-barrel fold metal-dependent hydrolase